MDDTGASADAETGSRASHRANSSVVSTKGFDPARFGLRLIYNGMLARGWQVLRDGLPISGLFDEYDDADAAMNEFRTDEAIAMEARRGGDAQRLHAKHDSAGLNEASPNPSRQDTSPSSKDET